MRKPENIEPFGDDISEECGGTVVSTETIISDGGGDCIKDKAGIGVSGTTI